MWDDLRVSATMTAVDAALNTDAPRFSRIMHNSSRGPSYSGLMGYIFDHGKDGRGLFQSAHFAAQLPHSYREGSAIEPHVHIRLLPGEDSKPGQLLLLEFEYCWSNMGEAIPQDTSIISINHKVSAEEMESDNILVSFGMIEKKNAKISSMLSCRFSRITIDPKWEHEHWKKQGLENDSFEGGLLFLEFDFHFQKDNAGSSEIYQK
jgi:hypothetical protein